MPRPAQKGLTEYELAIMKILWASAPLGVSEILDRFPRRPKPAYTSLLTVVRTMEIKGYIEHVQQGKAYLYSPVLKKDQYRKSQVKRLLHGIFDGDAASLAINLFKEEKLAPQEIAKIKKILEEL